MTDYVLDTSAILTALFGEPGIERVEELLRRAEEHPDEDHVYVPFIALMEVEYQLLRDMPEDEVAKWLNVVQAWPVEIAESDPEWRHESASIKRGGKVSLADAWVAALAVRTRAGLVHKDPEFEKVPGLSDVRLPYKERGGGS